ncbi:MAG TPA: LysM domain-containing protein [Streptosporangiaceae bacterium]
MNGTSLPIPTGAGLFANTPLPPPLRAPKFPPSSRYSGVETATLSTKDGRTLAYLRRRFIPPPDRFQLLVEHVVSDGDRLDLIAANYLGDPEQFWRLCDANAVMDPEELTAKVGQVIRITLPEGVQGVAG